MNIPAVSIVNSKSKCVNVKKTNNQNDRANFVNNASLSGSSVSFKGGNSVKPGFKAAVLSLIDCSDKELVATLVRNLDKIKKPHKHLNDVWRVKCLFDLIPQARTFIERLHDVMPERVLTVRDKFYDIGNPRNYRDSKVIVNIGTPDNVIPMEIICQVRTFFEFERKTHDYYATLREHPDSADAAVAAAMTALNQIQVEIE